MAKHTKDAPEYADDPRSDPTSFATTSDQTWEGDAETEISPELLEEGRKLGLDQDSMEVLGEKTLTGLIAATRPEGKPAEKPAKKETTEEPAPKTERFELDINAETDPDELVKAFKDMNKFYGDKLDDVVEILRSVVGEVDEHGQEIYGGKIDRLIDAAAEDNEALQDPTIKKKVAKQVKVLQAGYEAAGEETPPEDELMRQAMGAVGAKPPATQPSGGRRKARGKSRKDQFVQKPTGTKQGEAEDVRDRAVSNARRRMQESGLLP
jgi:hypothetical protein